MGEQTVWVLRSRYAELGLNLRAAWDVYIRFYTVFLTFSMAALAWTLACDKSATAMAVIWLYVALK
jgi:hypothetical protein